MRSIFNYVFGHDCAAGIAIISGDAAGFSYLDEPLQKDEIFSIIEITLKEEEFDDDEKAELRKNAALEIEKIHAKHIRLFAAYKVNC